MIAEHGWPGTSLVGDEGANAVWLLIQHADHDVELQERCLELLADASAEGEASPRNVAYLIDRVCVNRGRDQIYETQFGGRGDSLAPHPIEDPEHLDNRRASVGLEPFADDGARMHEMNRGDEMASLHDSAVASHHTGFVVATVLHVVKSRPAPLPAQRHGHGRS